MFGVDTKGTKPVFNLSPLLASLDGPIIAASSSFWAVPWVGGGGPVYASPISVSGKVRASFASVRCIIAEVSIAWEMIDIPLITGSYGEP